MARNPKKDNGQVDKFRKKYPHLADKALELLARYDGNPGPDRIIGYLSGIGTEILVLTAVQTKIVDRMWCNVFERKPSRNGDCRGLMIFGPPGSGKTMCHFLLEKRASLEMPGCFKPRAKGFVHCPFLRILLDGPVTYTGFYKKILHELGFVGFNSLKDKDDYSKKTREYVKLGGVQAIFVDEAQWLTARRGKKTMLEGTGLVKGLMDSAKIPVFLLVSTADSPEVDKEYLNWRELLKDETLVDRAPPIYLHPFKEDDDPDFIDFLRKIEPHYPFPEKLGLEKMSPLIFETVKARNLGRNVTFRGIVDVLYHAAVRARQERTLLNEGVLEALKTEYIQNWPFDEFLGKKGAGRPAH